MPSDVAVVIPYYNGSKFIRRAVASVLSQTVKPDQFVIVNDGSEPGEAAFLHELARESGFEVIDQENGGQGSARNAGVDATTARFICFLDQDDFFQPDHIEVLRSAAEGDDCLGWVYGDVIEADGQGRFVQLSMLGERGGPHPKTNIFDMLRQDMFVLPSASIINRKAFAAVGGFDVQFRGYEDDDLFLRIFRAGFTNKYLNLAVTVWCINTDSTSFNIRMVRSRMRYLRKLVDAFPNEPLRSRFYFRDFLVPRFHRSIVGEAFRTVAFEKSPTGSLFLSHREELIENLQEYCRLVGADPYVGRIMKLKVRLQTAIISTRSTFLCRTALFLATVVARDRH